MKFKVNIIETRTIRFDLKNIPTQHWPTEAKELAKHCLCSNKFRMQLAQQLPELKKSFLIAQMELLQSLFESVNLDL